MATRYYPLSTKQAALAQDQDWWEKVLGRAKFPQDVTEFLFGILVHPVNGTALLVVDDNGYNMVAPRLTPQQKAAVDAALLPETDPVVVAMKAAIAASMPINSAPVEA